jgi:hypothetical protein
VFTTRGVVNCLVVLHQKNKLLYTHFFRHAQSLESDWRKWNMRNQESWLGKTRVTRLVSTLLVCTHCRCGHVSKPQSAAASLWVGLDWTRLYWCVRSLSGSTCITFFKTTIFFKIASEYTFVFCMAYRMCYFLNKLLYKIFFVVFSVM